MRESSHEWCYWLSLSFVSFEIPQGIRLIQKLTVSDPRERTQHNAPHAHPPGWQIPTPSPSPAEPDYPASPS
jgi:hypothetical protein